MKKVVLRGFLAGTTEKGRAVIPVKINTTEEGLKAIKEKPLQSYGSELKKVTYCSFAIYEDGGLVGFIEEGVLDITEDEIDLAIKRMAAKDYYETNF